MEYSHANEEPARRLLRGDAFREGVVPCRGRRAGAETKIDLREFTREELDAIEPMPDLKVAGGTTREEEPEPEAKAAMQRRILAARQIKYGV